MPTLNKLYTQKFPDVIRKGCRFNLGQSIWRKIQSLDLSTEVKKCLYEDLMAIKPNDERVDNYLITLKKNIFRWTVNFNHQYGLSSHTR